MIWAPIFTAAVEAAVTTVGAQPIMVLADRIDDGWPDHAALQALPVPGFADAARAVLAARDADGVRPDVAAAYLRGVAAGHSRQVAAVRVEPVWTGPSTHHVPIRATAQVLVDVIAEADRELLLMTYSAKPYAPLLAGLAAAAARGVVINVVVETLGGAGSALSGAEPAAAFASLPGVDLWHWPVSHRSAGQAKMHAKLAVADRRVMLISSANLTQSGVGKNLEAGLLVHGGGAPRRAAEHITELMTCGVLARLRPGP